jgi:hypothetical protein
VTPPDTTGITSESAKVAEVTSDEIFTPGIYGYYVFISRLSSVNKVYPSVGTPTPVLFSANKSKDV